MMELDANVGKVVQAVRDAGIEKDTTVYPRERTNAPRRN
jgi:hypothetical protein